MEELVSFETAKLAKLRRFNIQSRYSVNKEGHEDSLEWTGQDFTTQDMLEAKGNTGEEHFLAPTQSGLQKWLREVHGISVLIKTGFGWEWYIDKTELGDGTYNSYEEALEAGLQEALKEIKL